MKYLKRFNEELKPSTYISASRKLAKIGHTDRAEELKAWAGETEKKEEMVKWKQQLQNYSPFGIYKMNVVNPESGEKFTADFALDVNFDELSFEDSFEYDGLLIVQDIFLTIMDDNPTVNSILLSCKI